MVAFVGAQRDVYGVEPICAVLPIAPSTYYEAKAREARSESAHGADAALREAIGRVWPHQSLRVRRAESVGPAHARGRGRPALCRRATDAHRALASGPSRRSSTKS